MRLIDADNFREWIVKQKRLSKNYVIMMLDETPSVCDIEQYEKWWKEGFHDGYIHGLEIAIIEIENTIGRTKKSEKLCAILQDYKKDKAGEQE